MIRDYGKPDLKELSAEELEWLISVEESSEDGRNVTVCQLCGRAYRHRLRIGACVHCAQRELKRRNLA